MTTRFGFRLEKETMLSRNVKDTAGRTWACREDNATRPGPGADVSILCTTATVYIPVRLTVERQWMAMSDVTLALLITAASPAPPVPVQ
jgi:hypothetical protein